MNLPSNLTQGTLLRTFLEHAPAALAMFDREMRYLHASKRWRADYGLGDRNLVGVSHYDVFPELREEWKRAHERALAGEILREEADEFVRDDGTVMCVRWEARPWLDETGAIGGIMIFTEDVTELSRALREAREATEWLRLAQVAAKAGTWQWNLRTGENVWSDELWKLYGLTKGSVTPSFEAWSAVVIPEDRQAALRTVTDAAAARRDISLEFRVRWPDGTIRHLLSRGAPLKTGGTEAEKYLGIVLDVTDSRRAEELILRAREEKVLRELAERSDERYRQLLEAAPDAMVVMDEASIIQLANAQVEKLFGYSRSELIGRPFEVLVPEHSRSNHESRVQAVEGPRELLARRRDGSEISVEVTLGVIQTEEGTTVSASLRDISDRKKVELAARLVSDRLRSAVESIQDAIAVFDRDGKLVLCNRTYETTIAGAEPAEGKSRSVLMSGLSARLSKESAARSEWKDFVSGELECAVADVRTVEGRSLRLTARRTPEGGLVETIWDLTEDEQRADELRAAHRAAEAGSTAKSEFVSSMSHELRTPLNAVLGFAQLLQRDRKEPLSPRHQERIAQIITGGQHLLRLIDDILDLSRVESGRVSVFIEPVNVGDVLQEVRTTLEPMAERRGIRIEAGTVAVELPRPAADRTRLGQILINFGTNAIKYNRPQGTVWLAATRVSPGWLRISVRDDGPGIPEDKQLLLFQPFQRIGQEMGPIEGTGIGLVITQRLARLMGGEVGFRSAVGQGSEFWVDIPVARGGPEGALELPADLQE